MNNRSGVPVFPRTLNVLKVIIVGLKVKDKDIYFLSYIDKIDGNTNIGAANLDRVSCDSDILTHKFDKSTYNDEKNSIEKYYVALEAVDESTSNIFKYGYFDKSKLEDVSEGNFVYFNNVDQFKKANFDVKAKSEFYKNNVYRSHLANKSDKREDKSEEDVNNINEVFSYHVNVGHGNALC